MNPGSGPPLLLEGPQLRLVPLEEHDVGPSYLAWMRDPAVVRHLEARFAEPSLEGLRAYVASQRADPDALFLAIRLKPGDRHVGNLKLGPIDRRNGLAEIGILVGEKDAWGKGVASEAIRLVCEHAFATLGLRKLSAGAYADNLGSIRAFEKAGFSVEARRRAHYRSGGGYVDGVLLGRFADR